MDLRGGVFGKIPRVALRRSVFFFMEDTANEEARLKQSFLMQDLAMVLFKVGLGHANYI